MMTKICLLSTDYNLKLKDGDRHLTWRSLIMELGNICRSHLDRCARNGPGRIGLNQAVNVLHLPIGRPSFVLQLPPSRWALVLLLPTYAVYPRGWRTNLSQLSWNNGETGVWPIFRDHLPKSRCQARTPRNWLILGIEVMVLISRASAINHSVGRRSRTQFFGRIEHGDAL